MSGSLQLTDTEVEHYSGRAQMQYQLTDLFGTTRMDFYSARPTEALNVPVWQRGSGVFKPDNTDHLDRSSEVRGKSIPLFAPIKDYTPIGRDQVDVRPDLRLLERTGNKHGQSVGNTKSLILAQFLSKVAFDANNIIEVDMSNDGTLGNEFRKGVEKFNSELNSIGVPAQGRFVKAKSNLFYSIASVREAYGVEFGGAAGIQNLTANVEIPYLGNLVGAFDIGFGNDWTASEYDEMEMPAEWRFDLEDVVGFGWYSTSWALRHQTSLITTAGWVEHRQAWLTMARLQMGFEAIQDEAIYVFMKSSS